MSPINIIVILAVVVLCGFAVYRVYGIAAGKKAAALMREQALLPVTQSRFLLQMVQKTKMNLITLMFKHLRLVV